MNFENAIHPFIKIKNLKIKITYNWEVFEFSYFLKLLDNYYCFALAIKYLRYLITNFNLTRRQIYFILTGQRLCKTSKSLSNIIISYTWLMPKGTDLKINSIEIHSPTILIVLGVVGGLFGILQAIALIKKTLIETKKIEKETEKISLEVELLKKEQKQKKAEVKNSDLRSTTINDDLNYIKKRGIITKKEQMQLKNNNIELDEACKRFAMALKNIEE